MDDDLEDEIFAQTLLTHFKLLSKVWRSAVPLRSLLGHQMRIYLLKPETIAFGVLLLVFFTSLNWLDHWCNPLWIKAQHAMGGLRVPFNFRGKLADAGTKSWQWTSKNVGVYAIQGRRPRMEDRFSVVADEDDSTLDYSLYGVFDGHGGESAAEFVEKTLFKNFVARLKTEQLRNNNRVASGSPIEQWDYAQILSEEILTIDKQLLKITKAANDLAGTTALVALIHHEKLIVANVGDSRGVICDGRGMAIPLSFDHKPHQVYRKRTRHYMRAITFGSGRVRSSRPRPTSIVMEPRFRFVRCYRYS